VLEEVGDRLEWIVGSGLWVGKLMEQELDGGLVSGVEEEMLTESI
jgi:hypothetical protein